MDVSGIGASQGNTSQNWLDKQPLE